MCCFFGLENAGYPGYLAGYLRFHGLKTLLASAIFSAAGLQQELKSAHGDKSLVIHPEDAESSFMECAASQISVALETVDGAVASSFEAIFGAQEAEAVAAVAPKKVD